jgi:hypothetical protein
MKKQTGKKVSEDQEALRQKLLDKCDEVWKNVDGEFVLKEIGTTRAPMSDGMYVHPCGKTYDEEYNSGVDSCSCKFCKSVRKAFGIVED